jgi:transcriptional regulator with XRE-family HTH domain
VINSLKQRELIADRIRRLMDLRPDLDTQVKLAKRAGVSQSTVARTLSCDTSPSADSLLDIARALGTTPAMLLIEDALEIKLLDGMRAMSPDARQRLLGFVSGLLSEHVSETQKFTFDRSSSVPSSRMAAHLKAAARPLKNNDGAQVDNGTKRARGSKG